MIAFCLHVVIGKHKSVKVCNWSITEKHVKIPEIVFPLRAVAGTVFAELKCSPLLLCAFNVIGWGNDYNFFQVRVTAEFTHLC